MLIKNMANQVRSTVHAFRETFKSIPKDVLQWFPGHMGKGLRQMQQRLNLVDCVIEVHDARIPLSGRNPNFQFTVSNSKPHIMILNKKDLADLRTKPIIEEKYKQSGISHLLYTNCRDQKDRTVKRIIPLAIELIESSNRNSRSEEKDFCIMVIGVPNVGKSSLINALRNKYLGKAGVAHVGAIAGITRSVQNKIKVCEEPLIYLLDTPGILTPSVQDVEAGLRLALCASLQDHLVGEEVIADYLLFWLNKHSNFKYVELMGLEEPTDNITVLLAMGALKFGKTQNVKNYDGQYVNRPDLLYAARYFVKAFRQGELGSVMMDLDRINT